MTDAETITALQARIADLEEALETERFHHQRLTEKHADAERYIDRKGERDDY